jgi:hypothetical protein
MNLLRSICCLFGSRCEGQEQIGTVTVMAAKAIETAATETEAIETAATSTKLHS